MPQQNLAAIFMTLVALAASCAASASQAAGLGYDPQADPFEQYHDAIASAQAGKKLVLVIAGGDWCHWCHVLNEFVKGNADIAAGLSETFVIVKVYVGDQNYNSAFFEQLPQARGAPHFWIISPQRDVLGSQPTGVLESGKNGYDKREFLEFIERWKKHSAQDRTMPDSPAAATAQLSHACREEEQGRCVVR